MKLTNHRIKFLNSGPVGKYIGSFIELLAKQRFSIKNIPRRLGIIADLNRWLISQKLDITELNHKKIASFMSDYNHRFKLVFDRGTYKTSFNIFLNLLYENGIIQDFKTKTPVTLSAREKILLEFDEYLGKQQGLSQYTRTYYKRYIGRFLFEIFGDKKINLKKLNIKDILSFIRKLSGGTSLSLIAASLRSFFKYMRLMGKINIDLSSSVPTVANKSEESIPEFLMSICIEI
ncbi:hypothetical protein GAMM_20042 [Gammaproteobacteria bacterium]